MLTDSAFLEPIVEYGPGTAYSWPHGDSFYRTVHGTGPTLHTTISIQNFHNPAIQCKNRVPAHMSAQPAAGALFTVQLKRNYVFQITKIHFAPHKNLPSSNAVPPDTIDKIITGTAMRISFCTPEREVKVLQPVKFMAKYAVIAGAMRNKPTRLAPLQFDAKVRVSSNAHSNPTWAPLREKALPGIHGRKTGVTTAPIRSAPRYVSPGVKPRDRAAAKLNPFRPNPLRRKTTSSATSEAFQAVTNSTGVKTRRSQSEKRIRLLSSLALRPLSRYWGKSPALTGPYLTLNPVAFFNLWAATPVAPSCGRTIVLWLTTLSN
jgi:hypothetical protein